MLYGTLNAECRKEMGKCTQLMKFLKYKSGETLEIFSSSKDAPTGTPSYLWKKKNVGNPCTPPSKAII